MARSYRETLAERGLQPFLWTQFLGAFNDNLFKIVVSLVAVHASLGKESGQCRLRACAIAGGGRPVRVEVQDFALGAQTVEARRVACGLTFRQNLGELA